MMLFLGNFGRSLGGLCSGRPLATRGRFLLHPTVLAALLELFLRNPAVSVRIDHLEVHDKRASFDLRQNVTLSFGHVPNAVAFSFIQDSARTARWRATFGHRGRRSTTASKRIPGAKQRRQSR